MRTTIVDPSAETGSVRSGITPPLYRQAIRRRDSLTEKLRLGLSRRLVIVQAGAGYGKTAFLADFAHEQNSRGDTRVAWLTLGRDHLDRVQLLEDLIIAIQAVGPGTGVLALDALRKSKDVHRRWDYFLDLFFRELRDAEHRPTLVILDQYERLAQFPVAREMVDHLAVALPPEITLLISTRQPPGLPSIPRLSAQDYVWRLGASDLCFTSEEVQGLFSQWLGLSTSDKALQGIMARTGGWPAAVQMAGALAACQGEHALLEFSGSQPEYYEYLCQGIYREEAPCARSYWMSIALVDEAGPALRRVLAEYTEALGELTRLEHGTYPGLADETKEGTTYHHNPVFRSFLLKEIEESLPAPRLRDLRVKLADFYGRGHQWDASLHQLLLAGEYQRASELVASLAETTIASNRLETLARWIQAFPKEELNPRPWLLLYEGVIHRINREWEKALPLYDRAAEVFRERGETEGLARTLWYASQVLAYRRNQRLATVLASEALTHLNPSELHSRAWILHSMGKCFFDLGQMGQALKCHEEARDLFAALGDARGQMMESQAMAWALHRHGHLKEAQHHYVRALNMQAKSGDINMLCWLRGGLAHLRAMRGDYSESVAELIEVVGIARRHHLRPAEAFALANLMDVYLDLGEYADADACYWQAITACEEFDDDAPQIDLRLKFIELERRRGQSHIPLNTDPSLSLADWIAVSNLELTKIANDLQEAAILLVRRRYDEAFQRAREAGDLSARIGAKYHQAQACYLLGRVHLLQGDVKTSAAYVQELLSVMGDEGYAGFLIRDPEATGELLASAILNSSMRDRLAALLLTLVDLREEVASPLLGGEAPTPTNKVRAIKEILAGRGYDLAISDPYKAVRLPPSKRTARAEAPQANGHRASKGRLEVFLFGPLKVCLRGRPVTDRAWRTYKAKELFAYLLTRDAGSATRDELLEVLWPELSMDSAVSNFHFTVHSLRHALEPHLPPRSSSSYLVLSGRYYQLELPGDTSIDSEEFRECVSAGVKRIQAGQAEQALAPLDRAIQLYQDDYLVDLSADWVEPIRQDLLRTYLDARWRLASLAYVRRTYDQVVSHAKAMLKKDNYMEDGHRLIMRAACEMGNPAMAVRQYDDLLRLLDEELNTAPEPATQQLYRQIREGTYQRSSTNDELSAPG